MNRVASDAVEVLPLTRKPAEVRERVGDVGQLDPLGFRSQRRDRFARSGVDRGVSAVGFREKILQLSHDRLRSPSKFVVRFLGRPQRPH